MKSRDEASLCRHVSQDFDRCVHIWGDCEHSLAPCKLLNGEGDAYPKAVFAIDMPRTNPWPLL